MASDSRSRSNRAYGVATQMVFILVAALFVYGFVAMCKDGERRRTCGAPCLLHPDYMGSDRRAPDFSLRDLGGRAVNLADLRGKVVVLNFWSKSCGPCLEEMPDLAELTRLVRNRGDVEIMAISPDDDPEDVLQTLHVALKEQPPFTVVLDPGSQVIEGKFGTHMFPETWFIDKQGVIRERFDGTREWNGTLVLDLIDDLRRGDACSATIDGKRLSGRSASICEDLSGS